MKRFEESFGTLVLDVVVAVADVVVVVNVVVVELLLAPNLANDRNGDGAVVVAAAEDDDEDDEEELADDDDDDDNGKVHANDAAGFRMSLLVPPPAAPELTSDGCLPREIFLNGISTGLSLSSSSPYGFFGFTGVNLNSNFFGASLVVVVMVVVVFVSRFVGARNDAVLSD